MSCTVFIEDRNDIVKHRLIRVLLISYRPLERSEKIKIHLHQLESVHLYTCIVGGEWVQDFRFLDQSPE